MPPHKDHPSRGNSIDPDHEPTNGELLRAIAALDQRAARVERYITGGSEPHGGLIVRVDRIEQRAESATFWTRTAIGGALTAVAGSAWALLTKTGHQ